MHNYVARKMADTFTAFVTPDGVRMIVLAENPPHDLRRGHRGRDLNTSPMTELVRIAHQLILKFPVGNSTRNALEDVLAQERRTRVDVIDVIRHALTVPGCSKKKM